MITLNDVSQYIQSLTTAQQIQTFTNAVTTYATQRTQAINSGANQKFSQRKAGTTRWTNPIVSGVANRNGLNAKEIIAATRILSYKSPKVDAGISHSGRMYFSIRKDALDDYYKLTSHLYADKFEAMKAFTTVVVERIQNKNGVWNVTTAKYTNEESFSIIAEIPTTLEILTTPDLIKTVTQYFDEFLIECDKIIPLL